MNIPAILRRAKALLPESAAGGYPMQAATKLPDPAPPKPPSGQSSFPGYRKQTTASASVVPKLERRLASTDTLSLRTAQTTKAVIRNFAIASPDLSATTNAYLRVGIPEEFTVVARNMDGSISPTGTQLAQEILRRVTYVPDYSQGFNPLSSVNALAGALGKEILWYGAGALEVVLDAARLPIAFVPVHNPSIDFYEENQGLKPVQKVGGEEIDLDIPTFIYTSVDQDLLDAYSASLLEAAIQPVLADQEFMNDLRKVLKKSIYPRITATLDEAKLRKSAPIEYQNDSKLMSEWLTTVMDTVDNVLSNSTPEQALVGFDSVVYAYMQGEQGDVSGNLQAAQDLINAKLATGAKTLPAILGHGQGGTHASTEAVLFVKSADVIRRALNELFSRALTISCRLMGEDVYVDFKYATIDLRPASELEAYKAMEQSRITELNSLGYLSDEETSVRLTGNLPPAGMKPLAGTMYKSGKTDNANPDSNTSSISQELKPDTPAKPKSPTKK